MKSNTAVAGVFFLLAAMVTHAAESPFNGTWRMNWDESTVPQEPVVLLLDKGIYECSSCVPVVHIRADGADQPIDHGMSMRVREIDSHTVNLTISKDGALVEDYTRTVSTDGTTMTTKLKDHENVFKRIKPGPEGANQISGSWQLVKSSASEVTYQVNEDEITGSGSKGWRFHAKFDGKDYPVTGSNSWDAVSEKHVTDRQIDEIDKLEGKVILRATSRVSEDGRKLTVLVTYGANSGNATLVFDKQPTKP